MASPLRKSWARVIEQLAKMTNYGLHLLHLETWRDATYTYIHKWIPMFKHMCRHTQACTPKNTRMRSLTQCLLAHEHCACTYIRQTVHLMTHWVARCESSQSGNPTMGFIKDVHLFISNQILFNALWRMLLVIEVCISSQRIHKEISRGHS